MSDKFKDDDTYLARWLNGDLSEEELAEFESSKEFEDYQKIADRTSMLSVPSWDKKSSWNEINTKGGLSKSQIKGSEKKSRVIWIRYASAACLLVIVGFWILFSGNSNEIHQTFAAEHSSVKLPDGSSVFLNASSSISFDSKSFEINRELKLEGEAFFEVEKGSNFSVLTNNGDVRVLGTSFNVKAREKILDVQCFSGSVGVSFDNFQNEEVLIKGNKLTSENKMLKNTSTAADDLKRPEWRDGRSKFTNASFDEVIKELERQFDIQIKTNQTVRNINNYNGGFAHDELELALDIVCSSINYTYKIEGKTVFLIAKE